MRLRDLYEQQMEKAIDEEDLLASIKNGRFMKDGSHLRVANLRCDESNLTSLEGAPAHVGGNFYCSYNQLASLKDVHKRVKEISGIFFCKRNPIKSHVLGLLLIKGITDVEHEVFGGILSDAIKRHPGEDQKSLKQRLLYASRQLIAELGEKGKALAQL